MNEPGLWTVDDVIEANDRLAAECRRLRGQRDWLAFTLIVMCLCGLAGISMGLLAR